MSEDRDFDYKHFVYDLLSMVMVLLDDGMSGDGILAEVAHDLGGAVRQEFGFLPRCSGYDKGYEDTDYLHKQYADQEGVEFD